MECKNCESFIQDGKQYCSSCGAKVVEGRFTLSRIVDEILKYGFGWDNKFLFTTRELLLRPEKVITEYLAGTRKRYFGPIAYYAVGLTVSLLLFNFFADQFSTSVDDIMVNNYIEVPTNEVINTDTLNLENMEVDSSAVRYKSAAMSPEESNKFINNVLKYYNLISFVSLPILAFMTFLVFGRKHNFAEHLIINTYLQALVTIIGIGLFIVSLIASSAVYSVGSNLFIIGFYSFAFKRIYQLSYWQTFLKFLKFLGILLVFFIIMTILVGIGLFVFKKVYGF